MVPGLAWIALAIVCGGVIARTLSKANGRTEVTLKGMPAADL
jgi:hypothetical protein